MERDDFKDWKEYLESKYRLKLKDTAGQPVPLQEKQWFSVGWGEETAASGTDRLVHHPHRVWFRSTFSRQEPWTKVDLIIKEEDRKYPPALYDGPIPLKPENVKDLKTMVEKHLPAPQRFFYLHLVENEGPEEEVP